MISRPPKPFVKWAGGKRRIAGQIISEVLGSEESITGYHDPFVGGGGMLFAVLSKFGDKLDRITINDLNSDLINSYRVVRDYPEELIDQLKTLENNHSSSDEKKYKTYAAQLSTRMPRAMNDRIVRASVFIYINRICYNGLYRVNSQGFFNVPLDRGVKKPSFDYENIRNVSSTLRKHNVSIRCGSYEYVGKIATKNEFVYFDPPYLPLTIEKPVFDGYLRSRFSHRNHISLSNLALELRSSSVLVAISNHATPVAEKIYPRELYKHLYLSANRQINSNGRDRKKKAVELLVVPLCGYSNE